MRRRHLIAAGSACVLGVPTSRAQPRKVRIGFLGGAVKDAVLLRNSVEPFLEALRGLGYVQGQNLELHLRFAEGLPDRLPGLAAELLALKPDVLVTMGPRPARVAQAATTTLPVVAAWTSRAGRGPIVKRMSGLSASSSAARPGSRSGWPSAQRK